jgi:hypothetical protein
MTDRQKFATLFLAAQFDPPVILTDTGRLAVSNVSELSRWTGLSIQQLGEQCA